MKRLSFILLSVSLFAQSISIPGTLTGVGQTINTTITIPLAPSAINWVCTPPVLQKGVGTSCVGTLDAPIPAGMTGTLNLTAPTGFSVSPLTTTIVAGSTTTPAISIK